MVIALALAAWGTAASVAGCVLGAVIKRADEAVKQVWGPTRHDDQAEINARYADMLERF